MNYAADVLTREREQIAGRLEELVAEVRALKAKLKALDEAIVSLQGMAPNSSKHPPEAKERLIDRIEKMLAPDGAGASPSELAARLTEAGRETRGETVSSLLNRLKNQGVAENRGRAWFRAWTAEQIARSDTQVQNGQVVAQTETEDDTPASSSVHVRT